MTTTSPVTSNPSTNTPSAPLTGLPSDNVTPYDPMNPVSTLINVNVSNVTKLSATNYITWSVQIKALLQGYSLDQFLDSEQIPSATVITNSVVSPNPAFANWFRQDRLVFSAILGSISGSCQALIASAPTSAVAWTTLAATYGRSSRGHIKQIKENMKRFLKGQKSIDDYMHFFKVKADELALLGKPMDHEDLLDLILAGLGDEFKTIKDVVHARDTPISFTELHERLLSHEVDISTASSVLSDIPITANTVNHKPRQFSRPNFRQTSDNRSFRPSHPQPRGYQGKCQLCGVQGHSARYCRLLRQGQGTSVPSQQNSSAHHGSTPWQPSAHQAALTTPASSPWLLDSGASHHITTDLANLSLHAPYTGGDEVVIGDGSSLSITHTGEGSQHGGTTHNRSA